MDNTNILLGYICEEDTSENLNCISSKIGGRPAWLNKENFPICPDTTNKDICNDSTLACNKCGHILRFILQLYASQDSPPSAFHRSLYCFGCENCGETFKVFRGQLPRYNKFLPFDLLQDFVENNLHCENLCNACGLPMAPTDRFIFDDNKFVHNSCAKEIVRGNEVIYNERKIDIEDAESDIEFESTDVVQNHDYEMKLYQQYTKRKAEDPDADLDESEQEAFKDLQIESTDELHNKFMKFMQQNPNHVIRYSVGGEPLWYNSENIPSTPDVCSNCGSSKQFEFQIQPNLITMLSSKMLEYAVLAIYTCSMSCDYQGGYIEESIVRQVEQTVLPQAFLK